ncbi:MAG: DUF6175 family protein [Bacteroidia bacterium]|nr:DUF6175 family protein [Bacteroidia bacterium]
MKKIIVLTFILINYTNSIYAQAKKPTIMVVPSDNWCNTNGFMQEYKNEGGVSKVPDYRKALMENSDLLLAIAKINELMADRGFPLKNLESSLKTLEADAAEQSMLMSKEGGEMNESPIDKLKAVAKADIWMQLTWSINKQGPKTSLTYILQGIDAYTDKQVAGASGTGPQGFTNELPVLVEEAVLENMDPFNMQLQTHFEDLFANGREVVLKIRTWDTWDYDLETEDFGDDELGILIEDWIAENTVQGRYNTTNATENKMDFEQVRIPLFYERNGKQRALDTRKWANNLRKHLRDTYEIESKLMTKGLGQAQLVIGGK